MLRDAGPDFSDSWRQCAFLTLIQVLGQMAFVGYRLDLTLKGVHLQWSPWTLGLLVSASSLVPALSAFYMGRLVDRVGYKLPTMLGHAATLLGCAVAGLTDRVWLLALSSMVAGGGAALSYVSLNLTVGVAAGPANRTRAYSLLTLGMSLATVIGPAMTGWGVDTVGSAVTFLLLIVPLVIAVAGVALLPIPPADIHVAVDGAARARGGGLLRNAAVRRVLLCSAMATTAFDLFTFLVPLHGTYNRLSATAVGLVVGGFGAGAFTARLGLPWLARRVSEWRMLQAVLLCTAAGFIAMPFCRTVGTLMPVAFLIGLVLGCGQPLLMTLTLASAPPGRGGETVGLRTSLTSGLQSVSPLLIGALGSAFGLGPIFWGMAAVLIGGGARVVRNERQA